MRILILSLWFSRGYVCAPGERLRPGRIGGVRKEQSRDTTDTLLYWLQLPRSSSSRRCRGTNARSSLCSNFEPDQTHHTFHTLEQL